MNPIIVSNVFETTTEKVWHALSDETALKKWYFNVQGYQFEAGNEFTFYESADSKNYLHRCRFLNIVPDKSIEYTWTHPSHSNGSSVVKWDIKTEGEKVRVTLTHTGVENFADAGAEFARENYVAGWDAIVNNLLRNYLYDIQKLVFEIDIDAAPAKVWKTLWTPELYTKWAEPFCAGTYYTGEMKQGNRIHFLTPNGEGMYSDLAYYKENETAIFKHIGMMKDFKELPLNAETEKWTGAFESYFVKDVEGKSHVKVEVDVIEKYIGHMKKTFPLAMQKLKAISES